MKRPSILCLAVFALAAPSALAATTTIFYDDFSGGTGNLHGTTPDTGSVNWVATATNFLANGTIGGTNAGTATLAFTPTNGLIYTLDASFNITNTTGDWIAFGFVNGQGTSNSTNNSSPAGSENRFLEGQTVGVAWMMARGDNTTHPNEAHLSNATLTGDNPGLGSTASWAGGPTNGGDIDMRIVLDTTGGSGAWTATWYAKRPADSEYTIVRATADLLSKDITSVGFGKSNTGVTGTIESFSLTSNAVSSVPAITGIELDEFDNVVITLDGSAVGLTVQRSNDLTGFGDVASTADGNTLTIDAADVDPNNDGSDFFRVRN